MKKSILLTALSLFCLLATAQVKVTSPWPTTPITFKRCVATGSTGYIDFLLTNETKDELQYGINTCDVYLYDDEGNCYSENGRNILPPVFGNNQEYFCVVPAGTTIKCRISFTGLDEYATIFTNISIKVWAKLNRPAYMAEYKPMTITNVPITRRD